MPATRTSGLTVSAAWCRLACRRCPGRAPRAHGQKAPFPPVGRSQRLPPAGLGVKVLSDYRLAALPFLIIKHVSNCVLSSRLWRAAGLMRIPGAREEPGPSRCWDCPSGGAIVHCPCSCQRLEQDSHWTCLPALWGRSVEEQYLPSAVHYSDRNNNHSSSRSNCLHGNSRQAWPSVRRNRHLRVCNANGWHCLALLTRAPRASHRVIGQLVLEHCNDVTMTGLRICATRSGLHAIASTVSIEACEVGWQLGYSPPRIQD